MTNSADKHIMIVEDSTDLQLLLSELFRSEGYELYQAFNGQQALEMLQNAKVLPSLILLDIMMPVMDGVEFYKKSTQDARLAAIPIIVMTADLNFKPEKKQMQVSTVVQKPIKIKNLLNIVGDTLK